MDSAEEMDDDREDGEFEDSPRTVAQIIADARAKVASPKSAFVGREYARELIDELWANGWTIAPCRRGDPFHVDPKIIPPGVAYQWNEKAEGGWVPVPAERHEGVFTPVGFKGDIVIGRLTLCERSKQIVDAANELRVAKAHQNVEDWKQKYGGQFSGGVRVWTGEADAPPPAAFTPVGEPGIFKNLAPSPVGAVFARQVEGSPVTVPPPPPMPTRRARYAWLRWLFDLISIEENT